MAGKRKVEHLYPCMECGKLRTAREGGTTFTVCDQCWDKHYKNFGVELLKGKNKDTK